MLTIWLRQATSVLFLKSAHKRGGPPGPQPTPPSASWSALESRTRGSGADEGVRPTSIYVLDFRENGAADGRTLAIR